MPSKHVVYGQLLRLYPRQYREKYANQMLQTLDDMVADQPTVATKNLTKAKAYTDLPFSILQQNYAAVTTSYFNDTPDDARRASVIGVLLMVPPLLIILTDATEKSRLVDSRVWVGALTIGLLVLPAVGFAINALTYLAWLFQRDSSQKSSLKNRLFNVKCAWPVLVVGCMSLALCLGVLFHDSVHCLVGSPVKIVHNPTDTWRCVSRGFLGGGS
jgi:hypothetical protein